MTLIDHVLFKEKANFSQELVKIAENSDHNIDPWHVVLP
jgi:hypothetical protein